MIEWILYAMGGLAGLTVLGGICDLVQKYQEVKHLQEIVGSRDRKIVSLETTIVMLERKVRQARLDLDGDA